MFPFCHITVIQALQRKDQEEHSGREEQNYLHSLVDTTSFDKNGGEFYLGSVKLRNQLEKSGREEQNSLHCFEDTTTSDKHCVEFFGMCCATFPLLKCVS